jgi:transcriptional regulator with XRE-family HTH domain
MSEIDFVAVAGYSHDDARIRAAKEDFDEFANLVEALVSHRKDQGLSQTDVADQLDTTQSVVSDFERIGGNPGIRRIQAYARAVGLRLRLVAETVAVTHEDDLDVRAAR